MDREQARQQIKHHEAAAARHWGAKREQHREAIRYLRDKYGIPEPVIIRAIPPEATTDFERLRARLQPPVASKPDWIHTKEFER